MRTPPIPLLFVASCLAGVGCGSRPAQELPVATPERVCATDASNPLHLISAEPQRDVDPKVESLLTQPTIDPRLAQINREIYQALRALDTELRKQQQLASCEQPLSAQAAEQARGGSTVSLPVADATGSELTSATARAPNSLASASGSGNFGQPGSLRKASLGPRSGGGNGATAPNVPPGSDNGIVARRLRNAAEQETDPKLRASLWKEYTEYKEGTSAK